MRISTTTMTLALALISGLLARREALAQKLSLPVTSGKKVVEYGWDAPTPAYLAAHLGDMEKRPFDGILFHLEAKANVLEPKALDESQLAKDLEAIDRIHWKKFSDNFLMMFAAAKQDWFDDQQWKTIEQNTRLVARAAKRAKCVGVCFDPEPYGANPWAYRQALRRHKMSFADYQVVVRKRGGQFVRSIERELPGAKILTFFHVSLFGTLCRPMPLERREAELAKASYALLPAFIEGMAQGAQTHVEIIDGNENAYYYTNNCRYLDSYHLVTQRARYLIAPGAWPAYLNTVRMGQALYIDQYYGLRQNTKTLGNVMTHEEQVKWLEHNTYWALYTTDRYVWCYSERMNWWTGDVPAGAEDAICRARNAIDAGRPLSFDLGPIIKAAEAKANRKKARPRKAPMSGSRKP